MTKLINNYRFGRKLDVYLIALIVLIILVTFIHTLKFNFVWDDYHYILGWPVIEAPLQNLPSILKGEMPLGQGTSYRPVRSLYMALSFFLWGKQPFGYHLQAILLHAGITVTLYVTLIKLRFKPLVSFSASLIFSLHPLQVQSVSWISGNFDIIAYLFFTLSLYLYLLHQQRPHKKLYAWSLVFAWLSFFSKEATLILPAILFLFDYFTFKGRQFRWQQTISKHKLYWLGIIAYVVLRSALMPQRAPFESIISPPIGVPILVTMLTFWYYRLMLWPNLLSVNQGLGSGLSSFYREDVSQQVLASKLINVQFYLGLSFLLLGMYLVKKLKRKFPLPVFLLAASFVSLIPVLQLVPTNTLYLDLYSYVSLFFLSGFAAWCLSQVPHVIPKSLNQKTRRAFYISTVFIIISFLAYKTYSLSQVWSTDLSLWTFVVKHSPQSAKANYNLGLALYRENDIDQAMPYLEKAVQLKPNDPTKSYGLLNAYLEQNNIKKFTQLAHAVWQESTNKIGLCQTISQLIVSYNLQDQAAKITFCYSNN